MRNIPIRRQKTEHRVQSTEHGNQTKYNKRVIDLPFVLCFLCSLFCLIIVSCTHVLKEEYLKSGDTNVSFPVFLEKPTAFKGKLYILGGTIAETKQSPDGSLIEALYVPVSQDGRLESSKGIDGRFLALFPKTRGVLDSKVYREGRLVTIAGEFTGLQPGKIDEMEYIFPVFEIKDMYLWNESSPGSWYVPYPQANPYLSPYLLRDPFWEGRQGPSWR